jgi:phosphoribosylamine---glycine ligase
MEQTGPDSCESSFGAEGTVKADSGRRPGAPYLAAESHPHLMRILVIGSGGREHALCHALSESPAVEALFCAPGNPGTSQLATNVDLAPTDHDALVDFRRRQHVDLTVVGPEAPLVAGLADRFEDEGLAIVGPSAAAARLEGSKRFAKEFMVRHGIPTASARSFTPHQYDDASLYVERGAFPIVLKADGLAAGKGVLICNDVDEARAGLSQILIDEEFGLAGASVLIEEFMHGEEASVFVLTDGTDYVLLASAQDHKRIGEGDTGPNTGGMGAYAPAPVVTPEVLARVEREVIVPTLRGMAADGHPYRGFLYVGLMIAGEEPRVVEFNCRLGDPEAQVVLPLLDADLAELCKATVSGKLGGRKVGVRAGAAACVVLASEGYPGTPRTGDPIEGLDANVEGAHVYHAGTALDASGRLVTSGGRVLGVTGIGPDLATALERAYVAADQIHFEGRQLRRDIGHRGLRRAG